MARHFLNHLATPAVRQAQQRFHGRAYEPSGDASLERDALGAHETDFIQSRDSFYLGTVSESRWPYVQHRGGPQGFLRVIDPHTLAFADRAGNRQLISTGNITANDRVALFLMDYPQRTRLKILGRARVTDSRDASDRRAHFSLEATDPKIERAFFIDVVSFDWNCPQYITPRYTLAEVEALTAPLRTRIAELEAKLKQRD